jgi:dolichol-phosphate mannosyltransferase
MGGREKNSPELLVVLPVFNEQASLEKVVREWMPAFAASTTDYCVLAMDDGSTDDTPRILDGLRREFSGVIEVVNHANRGHGQTVVEGYRIGCERGARFVFQMDSDGQCDPQFFPEAWKVRETHDVVYGVRVDRHDGWRRKLASRMLRVVIFAFGGTWCEDANTPYRLMRVRGLQGVLGKIPPAFDLANIALAVLLKRAGWRHGTVAISFRERSGGEPKVPLSRFGRKAVELARDLWRLG